MFELNQNISQKRQLKFHLQNRFLFQFHCYLYYMMKGMRYSFLLWLRRLRNHGKESITRRWRLKDYQLYINIYSRVRAATYQKERGCVYMFMSALGHISKRERMHVLMIIYRWKITVKATEKCQCLHERDTKAKV